MRMNKKIIGILLLVIMMLYTALLVAADENEPYQAVLDKLNKEYAMDIHFMSIAERYEYSVPAQRSIDITPEEFEVKMRKAITENARAKAEADRKYAELESRNIVKSGSGICDSVGIYSTRTSATVTRSKKISGATAHLTATVSNSPGYWRYSEINSVYTDYLEGVNSKPPFFSETYNYDLIDARRTCALRLYGYTLGDYGTIIDGNAYRYVEFWAGNGM